MVYTNLEVREPTVKVTTERLPECRVQLNIEIDEDRLERSLDSAYKRIANKNRFPGFRPGKAPKEVVERYVGPERVKERAADKIMQPAYSEALKETNIEPWAPADVDVVEFEIDAPMVFKAKVPLAPKVELGDYVGLEIERTVPPVTDDMIEAEIQGMLDRQGKFNPVTDREVRAGDTAVIDLVGKIFTGYGVADGNVYTFAVSLPEVKKAGVHPPVHSGRRPSRSIARTRSRYWFTTGRSFWSTP